IVLLAKNIERLLAVLGQEDAIPLALENGPAQITDEWLIVGHENGLRPFVVALGHGRRDDLRGALAVAREVDVKDGSLSLGAVSLDPAVALVDDAVYQCETQARRLTRSFGGEERLVDLGTDLRRNAAASVLYVQANVLARPGLRLIADMRLIDG